jgi:hypothetical protein
VLTAPGFLASASGVGATYRLYNYDPPGATPPVYSRWNPCAPVSWKANVTQAGSSPVARRAALQDVAGALARISQATGVRFRYAGQTNAVPTRGALPSVAPLVIAWARPGSGAGRTALLRGGAAGWGGISGLIYTSGGRFHYRITSAYAVLNAAQNNRFRPGFGSGSTRGALLMHELGHAMGLGHSDYTSQIMYPTILPRRTTGYGFWDRRALTRVGRAGGCVPR